MALKYWAKLGSDMVNVSETRPSGSGWIEMESNRPLEILYTVENYGDIPKRFLPTEDGRWVYNKELTNLGIWERRNQYQRDQLHSVHMSNVRTDIMKFVNEKVDGYVVDLENSEVATKFPLVEQIQPVF